MQHQLEIGDNGKSIRVSPGDELVVRLEENPTTGYMWDYEEGQSSPLVLTESTYEVFTPPGVGSGGIRIFHFRIGKGQGHLTLKNWQRWSGDVHQVFEIEISSQ